MTNQIAERKMPMSDYLIGISEQLYPENYNLQAGFEESVLRGEISILVRGAQTSLIFHNEDDFFKYAGAKNLHSGFYDGNLQGWRVKLSA